MKIFGFYLSQECCYFVFRRQLTFTAVRLRLPCLGRAAVVFSLAELVGVSLHMSGSEGSQRRCRDHKPIGSTSLGCPFSPWWTWWIWVGSIHLVLSLERQIFSWWFSCPAPYGNCNLTSGQSWVHGRFLLCCLFSPSLGSFLLVKHTCFCYFQSLPVVLLFVLVFCPEFIVICRRVGPWISSRPEAESPLYSLVFILQYRIYVFDPSPPFLKSELDKNIFYNILLSTRLI